MSHGWQGKSTDGSKRNWRQHSIVVVVVLLVVAIFIVVGVVIVVQ